MLPKKKKKLPPELTGKYPKKYLSARVLETQHQLSFGIYRDKGRNRKKVTVSSFEAIPSPELSHVTVPDVPIKKVTVTYGEDGFFPESILVSPIEPDHSVSGFIYDRGNLSSSVEEIRIETFTLFSGPEFSTLRVSKNLKERMNKSLYVPRTYTEQVEWLLAGGATLPIDGLPIAQIAQIRKEYHDCRLHPDWPCANKSTKGDSFRDNLR